MGLYDFLEGNCPNCLSPLGSFQIKWFPDASLRNLVEGSKMPHPWPDGIYPLESRTCSNCQRKGMVYAVIKNNTFLSFSWEPKELPTWNPDWEHRYALEILTKLVSDPKLKEKLDRETLIQLAYTRTRLKVEALIKKGKFKPFPLIQFL